jgi:2-hydroxychromene-2-carboxylate isomerase
MIEFFFDISSPWTYLAFHNIQPLAAELKVPIQWRPILVGGIFNSVNPSVYAMRENPVPAKWAYMKKDLADWAREANLKITMQTQPGTSSAMLPFAKAAFEAYWAREEDISQDAVLADVCESVGVNVKAFFDGIGLSAIKDQLKANTEEVIRRGGFGSPTMFVGDDMYFGNDRLQLVRAAVLKLG